MKNVRRLVWFSLASACTLLLAPSLAYADVNDFTVTDFSADYYLSSEDPQGIMHVVENIKVNFTDQNHGILRAIPKSYKDQSLKLHVNKISSDSGAPSQYTTYEDSGNEVLKIGDLNRTVTGAQSYRLDYTLQNVVTFYDDHDELYWDINGDQWQQSFQKVTARFHLPKSIAVKDKLCFTGQFGSTEQQCSITESEDSLVVATTKPLMAHETLTAVIGLPKGHFAAPTAKDWWRDNYGKVLAVLMPPLIIGGWALNYWRVRGKDLKGRGVIVPEYQPPKLTPAESAVVYDYRLNTKDISATIIDLAIRGYIRIIEIKEKKIFKDKLKYELELLKTDTAALKPHEQEVLNALFSTFQAGQTVKLESLKSKFYKTVQKLQTSLPKDLVAQGYFFKDPRTAGTRLWVLMGVLFVLIFIFHSWLSLGLLISAAVVGSLAWLMPKRTQLGVDTKEALQGLKLYMITAEKDRIKMLQSPDAPYAADYHEPKKTVKLFEKLLPFAIFLGVENEWAKQFEGIYKAPPDWYSGNWATFNTVYLASSLSGSVNAMSANFSPPSSSGGSGFSGGGAGGGGGGGGGGGW